MSRWLSSAAETGVVPPGEQVQRQRSEDARDSKATEGPSGDSVAIPDASPSIHHDEPPSIPGYDILGVLGRGGMGVVYKARQQRLKRVVALKVIRVDCQSADSTAAKRFQREALAAAQLCHPNVVVVFDSDQVGDTYFIAMEYVAGEDLYRTVKQGGPLGIERACEYARQAALGLQHAYERGFIHRDIKPSNLLLTNVPAVPGKGGDFGLVKILDMGLALARDLPNGQRDDCTQDGALMGTPDYIAPEQAMDSHAVDIRSDLYSLGCTFYFLLTGKAPFGGLPVMQKLMMHQTGEPRRVEELRPEVSAELGSIVHKLMAKHPDHRYQTPAQLNEALAALGNPKPTPQRIVDSVVLPSSPVPSASLKSTESTLRVAILPETQRVEGRPNENHADKVDILEGHRGWVTVLAFTADRKTLVSGGVDGTIRLWTMSSSKGRDSVLPRGNNAEVGALAITPDNRMLASGSGSMGGGVSLWADFATAPRIVATIPCPEITLAPLLFSPTGRFLAGGGSDGSVRVWDISRSNPVAPVVLQGHGAPIKSIAFTSDEQAIASGSQDGSARLWNLGNFCSRKHLVLDGDHGPVRSVSFSPDNKTLALGCLDQSVRLWDLSGTMPKQSAKLTGHSGVLRLVYFNRDGATLLSVCDSGKIILWNTSTSAREREWLLPRAEVYSGGIAFTRDGRYLAAGNSEGQVCLYRLYPRRDR